MSRNSRPASGLAIVLASAAFVVWAAAFIASTSARAWDGRRYFCLFDDAMISMRYADNLAHGRGVVWNVGERVEGYTNPLMTLLMALPSALLEKRFAVLAVQIMGVVVSLVIALLTLRLAEELREPARQPSSLLRVTGFCLGLAYYPLAYWALMGMETGLLALLLLACLVAALRFGRLREARSLWVVAGAGALAYLTRADSVVVSGPLLLLSLGRAWREPRLRRRTPWILGAFAVVPIAHVAFRLAYYGSLLPLTYTLKLGGFPLPARLENGFFFLMPFFAQTWPLFLLAILGVFSAERWRRGLALALPLLFAAYQLSIGGDFSEYWRFVSPGVPILLVLALYGSLGLAQSTLGRLPQLARAATLGGLSLLAGLVVLVNRPFASELLLRQAPFCADDCVENVDIALAIRDLTHRSASVGVFMAGTIPYYSERPALDFLGKSDPHVAALAPDLSGAIGWRRMRSLPGHNKYDLSYSIVSRRPVYIEGCRWGAQDVCGSIKGHYAQVVHRGKLLYLLRDSPFVDWRKARPSR